MDTKQEGDTEQGALNHMKGNGTVVPIFPPMPHTEGFGGDLNEDIGAASTDEAEDHAVISVREVSIGILSVSKDITGVGGNFCIGV